MKSSIYLITGLSAVAAMFFFFTSLSASAQATTSDTRTAQRQPVLQGLFNTLSTSEQTTTNATSDAQHQPALQGHWLVDMEDQGEIKNHEGWFTTDSSELSGYGGYPAGKNHIYGWKVTSGIATSKEVMFTAIYNLGAPGTKMQVELKWINSSRLEGTWSDNLGGQYRGGTMVFRKADEDVVAPAERSESCTALLLGQAEIHKRTETLLAAQEQLLMRQEADVSRFEKILDSWENQQKQYQKYLDTLKK
jgi:hypothetical protein